MGEPCSVFIVFEDRIARQEAQRMYEWMRRQVCEDVETLSTWCAFGDLADPERARRAARVATTTDLLVFALRADLELPPAVKTWVESWLPDRCPQDRVLVALVGLPADAHEEVTSIHDYLLDAARRGGMSYLEQTYRFSRPSDVTVPGTVSDRTGRTTSALGEVLRPPVPPPRWGLNE
jgi:hypothetical protein